MTKHAEIPQTLYIDKAVDVGMQRQVPQVQTVLKPVEVLPTQFVGTVMSVPVITQVITQVRQVTKHVESPQTQLIDKVVDQSRSGGRATQPCSSLKQGSA